jgi:hypothetical protein
VVDEGEITNAQRSSELAVCRLEGVEGGDTRKAAQEDVGIEGEVGSVVVVSRKNGDELPQLTGSP